MADDTPSRTPPTSERLEAPDRLATLIARARTNLSRDAKIADAAAFEAKLQAAALELALEWIVGDQRPGSPGEQTEIWLGRLYETLYPEEQPDAAKIYTRFGLTLPKAQYVARLLLARRQTHWRTQARAEVWAALETIATPATKAVKGSGGATSSYVFSLSRGGFEELSVLYSQVVALDASQSRPPPPKRQPSAPTLIWFRFKPIRPSPFSPSSRAPHDLRQSAFYGRPDADPRQPDGQLLLFSAQSVAS